MPADKAAMLAQQDAFDLTRGFAPLQEEDGPQIGWLLNACNTSRNVENVERSGVELYFLAQDGSAFKTTLIHAPYFYVAATPKRLQEALGYCQKTLEGTLLSSSVVSKEDLDLPNHLSGIQAQYIQLVFRTVSDLVEAKQKIYPSIAKNKQDPYHTGDVPLIDIREYDVPYLMRVAIDQEIRIGAWYSVRMDALEGVQVERIADMVDKAEPVVLAFDIECTKAPLKFPDATVDQIYMISYMVDRQGYLICNREFVSQDVDDFEYTPKGDYPGPFECINCPNEFALIRHFLDHVKDINPHIFVTYNGDFFDWPFLETRAQHYGIDLAKEIGISQDRNGEYRGKCCVHLDAYCWVKRDSYLPQGSQGLKAVTKYKLGYDPVEVDPEDMLPLAQNEPLKMASYSVSDAVATFYLYDKYVHLFVFSLCTIIPLGSEDVLRKGSGTLCEALLMVEAYRGNIICPNKQTSKPLENTYKGHVVGSETYIGGHVECLESGVFRADLEYHFNVVPSALDNLIKNIDRDLTFALEVELDIPRHEITNYTQVRQDIVEALEMLRDTPDRWEKPLIYHLDVAAMYPNIILTNRLQPSAMVQPTDCAACVHSTSCESSTLSCQRSMEWVWRGEYFPATRSEFQTIQTQLSYESVGDTPYGQLPEEKRTTMLTDRIKQYCNTVYKKNTITATETRTSTVCMRENAFYVNTVRAFRDRRYDYKILTKVWQKKAAAATDPLDKVDATTKFGVYDSLQLAHKCILNSFYGYVMRRGARWHSMEMAGIVTNTGSQIITQARQLVEQLGRPLELDTDGIWAMLPGSFPDKFKFKLKDGSTRSMEYPCAMLNAAVQENFTNHQYEDAINGKYQKRSECSIFFELDGPYKCMVIPASTEEGKLLKKRYAVFNFSGKLTELKGFELKRRGELELIKAFQSQVFPCFLEGKTLKECYDAVADCANRWLDILETKGQAMEEEEVLALLTENKNMSGRLEDYGNQKSTSITTARRLGEFLGPKMLQDKGLNCKLIVLTRPYGEKVTERAVPTAIFSAEPAVKKHFLRKWCRDPGLTDLDVRSLLDWDYYRTRFAGTVQKIILLPAAFQHVANPVPRIPLPPWMQRKVRERLDTKRQTTLGFLPVPKPKQLPSSEVPDIEDAPQAVMEVEEDPTSVEEVSSEVVAPVKKTYDNFEEWLRLRKQSWRRKRQTVREMPVAIHKRKQNNVWHFLEVQDTPIPGLCDVWAINEGKVEMKQIDVGTSVYQLGTHGLDGNFQEIKRYVPNESHMVALVSCNASAASTVDTLYESTIRASSRLLWTLGGIVQPPSSQNQRLVLSAFHSKPTLASSYLDNASIHRLALIVSTNASQQVGYWCLVVQADNKWTAANAWLLDAQGAISGIKLTDWRNGAPLSLPRMTSQVVSSLAEVVSGINGALAKWRDVPSVVVAHVPKWLSRSHLRSQFRGLNAFPLVVAPAEDSSFPMLTWRQDWQSRLIRSLEHVPLQYQELLDCAKYAQLPVGNLHGDLPLLVLDTLYARLLQKHQHVWWGPKDLTTSAFALDGFKPVVVPGAYTHHMVVDLSLDGLAIQALLSPDGEAASEENVAFRLVRQLASQLFNDVISTKSPIADSLLQHFYRWLASPSAQFYDPNIHAMMQRCMQQVLLQLLAEMKRLGATIVYADVSRIVMDTQKSTVVQAKAYLGFITRTLQEAFPVLQWTPSNFYTHVLFLDMENLGGMEYTDATTEPQVMGAWNMARYLPRGVDEYCRLLIAQFIKRRYDFTTRHIADNESAESVENALVEYSQKLIATQFTDKLLRLVPDILSHSHTFPVLAGSHLPWSHASLELIKCITHVWGLDTTIGTSVMQVKRTLLKTLNISEFSDEAVFVNPSKTFVLPDIICTHCNVCRNVDLCREPGLMEELSADDSVPTWQCPRCTHLYDLDALEHRLVHVVHTQFSLPYQLRDVVCQRCRLPNETQLNTLCQCTGALSLDAKDTDIDEVFRIVHHLAKHQQFRYLLETMERLMS
ncbi:Aste57867_22688 [Aphanomyces stellatus]|uniref:DNA polymerase epsilon catalytic subunit n=1 Tax=Aphanomyces stellatus TaxID=120398 RepID=A0A485LKN9_9STRA|nr:hypothetical protein As57867_022618 [Aphanomyces stellatus]VFT99342.1 Aste57867_22688 [Aphanomyces stellatus]